MICEISKVQLLWKGHSNESDPVKNQSPKVCGSTTLSHKNTLKSRGSDPALLPGKGMSVVGNNALGLVHKVFSFFKQSMATVLNGLLHPLPACDATSGFYLLPWWLAEPHGFFWNEQPLLIRKGVCKQTELPLLISVILTADILTVQIDSPQRSTSKQVHILLCSINLSFSRSGGWWTRGEVKAPKNPY